MVKKLWWLLTIVIIAIPVSASQEKDPTAPLAWTTKQPEKKTRQIPVPELQSIVCKGTEECYAILNDQVVESGERLAGFSIIQVTPTQVELKRGPQRWTLELFSLDIKE